MGKNAPRILSRPQGSQRCDHRQSDGRHGNELEQAREYGGNEVKELVERRNAKPSQSGAQEKSREPQNKLSPFSFLTNHLFEIRINIY